MKYCQTWPLPKNQHDRLVKYFRRLFKADAARLSAPLSDKIFLILGTKRNTKDDPGHWVNENGETMNWDYVHETTVASGNTVDELIENARRYRALCLATPSFKDGKYRWDSPVKLPSRSNVHPTYGFNLNGCTTGRVSASKPNESTEPKWSHPVL